jgi:PadR family transcriptional regulator PadR
MSSDDLRLLQGTLDTLVMKALAFGPRHGYAVAEWIRKRTNDVLLVEDGALYTALHRMEKRRWLESEWGLSENNRKAKFYSLTVKGTAELERAGTNWDRYSAAVSKVLSATLGDA